MALPLFTAQSDWWEHASAVRLKLTVEISMHHNRYVQHSIKERESLPLFLHGRWELASQHNWIVDSPRIAHAETPQIDVPFEI